MNTRPLDELYFEWLYSQVADGELTDPEFTYWNLLRLFFKKQAVWTIANDENRLIDGKDLRLLFISEHKLGTVNKEWRDLPCSFLELMVGISRRLAFEGGGESHYWFWKMTENLRLLRYNDSQELPEEFVDETLDRVIFRNYKANGRGGLFPLRDPKKDQRQVELWYQMAAYVLEQNE